MESLQHPRSHNVGWRLRILRQRHALTLVEVARLAGLDVSYLSRLERDALQNAKPKPDTISRVLDALGATLQEREAVYHIERPPLGTEEITEEIRTIAAEIEESAEAYFAGDEHWYIHYYNRAARAALGLNAEEYEQVVGGHMLHMIIDPSNPRYYCVPDAQREQTFRARAVMFQRNFAGEEFDNWYQQVVARIYDFPWAAYIWENTDLGPQAIVPVLTIGRDNMSLLNRQVGMLNCRFELHSLVLNPRFFLASWTPVDEETRRKMQELRERPEFNYSLDPKGYKKAAMPVDPTAILPPDETITAEFL